MSVFSKYSRKISKLQINAKVLAMSGNTKNASNKSAIEALMLVNVNEPFQNIALPFCKTTCLFSGLIWEKESEIGTC